VILIDPGPDTGFLYLAATQSMPRRREYQKRHHKALKGLGSKAIACLGHLIASCDFLGELFIWIGPVQYTASSLSVRTFLH
jgi:hypothetical protein